MRGQRDGGKEERNSSLEVNTYLTDGDSSSPRSGSKQKSLTVLLIYQYLSIYLLNNTRCRWEHEAVQPQSYHAFGICLSYW